MVNWLIDNHPNYRRIINSRAALHDCLIEIEHNMSVGNDYHLESPNGARLTLSPECFK